MSSSSKSGDPKELRTFGITLGVVCLVWAGIFWWRGEAAPIPWFLGASPVLILLALFAPKALHPLHRIWMPAAKAVAHALTWLMLTIAFFLVFTPYAVILRLLGKDPLHRRIDRSGSSYWVLRHDGPFDPDRARRQY